MRRFAISDEYISAITVVLDTRTGIVFLSSIL